jgi:hypothetical protein
MLRRASHARLRGSVATGGPDVICAPVCKVHLWTVICYRLQHGTYCGVHHWRHFQRRIIRSPVGVCELSTGRILARGVVLSKSFWSLFPRFFLALLCCTLLFRCTFLWGCVHHDSTTSLQQTRHPCTHQSRSHWRPTGDELHGQVPPANTSQGLGCRSPHCNDRCDYNAGFDGLYSATSTGGEPGDS